MSLPACYCQLCGAQVFRGGTAKSATAAMARHRRAKHPDHAGTIGYRAAPPAPSPCPEQDADGKLHLVLTPAKCPACGELVLLCRIWEEPYILHAVPVCDAAKVSGVAFSHLLRTDIQVRRVIDERTKPLPS